MKGEIKMKKIVYFMIILVFFSACRKIEVKKDGNQISKSKISKRNLREEILREYKKWKGTKYKFGGVLKRKLLTFENGFVMIKKGQLFTLDTDKDTLGDETRIGLTYDKLAKSVKEGTRILIDDGKIDLRVAEIKGTKVICKVINGGTISDRKGVNLPNVQLSMPYISAKDYDDIVFGIKQGLDYIAASFVRSAQDILDIRKILDEHECKNIGIIAKR